MRSRSNADAVLESQEEDHDEQAAVPLPRGKEVTDGLNFLEDAATQSGVDPALFRIRHICRQSLLAKEQ